MILRGSPVLRSAGGAYWLMILLAWIKPKWEISQILPTFSNCKHIQLGYWWQFFCQKIVCFFQPHILFVFRSLLGWIIIIEIFFEVGLGRFHNKGVDHTKLWSKGIVSKWVLILRTRSILGPSVTKSPVYTGILVISPVFLWFYQYFCDFVQVKCVIVLFGIVKTICKPCELHKLYSVTWVIVPS